MYTRLHTLSETAVTELRELKDTVSFVDSYGARRRQGKNDTEALSIYNTSNWFYWTHAQREIFRKALPEKQTQKTKQVWFLDIPARTGFLDVMTYWINYAHLCGKICAYSLTDKQTIYIEGNAITLNKGEGIYFCLSQIHQIKPSKDGQLWACVMTRVPVEDLK
ncbi:hypothetical protein D3C87_1438440 [compost metagenome]